MDSISIFDGPSTKKRRTTKDSCYESQMKSNNEYKKIKKHVAKFRLKGNTGDNASLSTALDERIPLMLTDIQHLLLHSLLGNLNISQPPRWYVLEKCNHVSQTTCIILEGLSINHWNNFNDQFVFSKKCFKHVVEILTPSIYDGSLVQELALVPLTEAEKEDIIKKYGSMNLALEARKDLMVMMKAVFPINDMSTEIDFTNTIDAFPRTQLILSAWQLIEENYPVPLKGKLKDVYADYVMSKEEYKPVSSKSPMFGIDCEMCMTTAGSELTRVSIVNEKHKTIYESLVKPYNDITDYLTRYSGITKSLLTDITKRLEDVQKDIIELLPADAILVGQSVNADLHALKMMHPYIIDTSLIYNIAGERTRKPKLKVLAKEFLNEDIQCGKGHCPTEDSLTSLKLVQLKLSKSLEYGDAVHTNRQKYKENIKNISKSSQYVLSIFNHMIEQKKSSIIVGCDDITGDYHNYLNQAKESVFTNLKKTKPKKIRLCTVDTEKEAISTLADSVNTYNFAMVHLKIKQSSEECEQIKQIDGWIEQIWNKMDSSALCVVIFGGTTRDNGIAMMKVKHL